MTQKRQPPPVQFRPGDALGRRIDELARFWGIAENEACKRLVALAVSGLGVGHYPLVLDLVGVRYGRVARDDFFRGCEILAGAIDVANRARQDLGHPPLTAEEALAIILETIREASRQRFGQEETGPS